MRGWDGSDIAQNQEKRRQSEFVFYDFDINFEGFGGADSISRDAARGVGRSVKTTVTYIDQPSFALSRKARSPMRLCWRCANS